MQVGSARTAATVPANTLSLAVCSCSSGELPVTPHEPRGARGKDTFDGTSAGAIGGCCLWVCLFAPWACCIC
jgi:hypothetical protein